MRESHGAAIAVSEQEIIEGVKEGASCEGLFMAPEGGACVAAARKLKVSGHLSPDEVRREHGAAVGWALISRARLLPPSSIAGTAAYPFTFASA